MPKLLTVRHVNGQCVECAVNRRNDKPTPPAILQRSVGQGGANLLADVRAVQARLNAIPAGAGGPTPLLDIDGIAGPKTIAAIHRYQRTKLGFSDGRVDPTGPTWKSLAQPKLVIAQAPRSAAQINFAIAAPEDPLLGVVKAYLAMMPTIRAAIMSARRRLNNVERFITSHSFEQPAGPGFDRERHNMALLDECFGLSQFADPSSPYRKIKDVFQTMSEAAARCRLDGDPTENGLLAVNPVESLNEPMHEAAFVATTGFYPPFETLDLQGHDIRSDRIYLTGNAVLFLTHTPTMLCLIIHELAHFVSRVSDPVRDKSSRVAFWDPRPFSEMLASDRISSAENYGWFGARSYLEPFAF
ncbi:MAG: hypothetical protein GEU91_22035 [Rhizobiales bacterium]|nr:hypothetical protein [Hyphomicrobiales bacterium]